MDDGPEPLPLIALTLGDPAGIGCEITAPAAREAAAFARVVAIGPAALRPDDAVPLERPGDLPAGERFGWIATDGPGAGYDLGRVQAGCGAAAVAALRRGHDLAVAGDVDALVTGPVNKAALHAAGVRVEGQTQLLSEWASASRTEMIGFAGRLRVMLATRHMPLRDAIARIDGDLIVDRLALFDDALGSLGIAGPRQIAVAGLNPHAGEGGLLGEEDDAILAPAVERARARGIDAVGPISPDTVFSQGVEGLHAGVLALYHDQAFIPLKLVAGGRGVTFIAGLPYARFSPMHGTAFDIVGRRAPDGQSVADHRNLLEALRMASASARRGPE